MVVTLPVLEKVHGGYAVKHTHKLAARFDSIKVGCNGSASIT